MGLSTADKMLGGLGAVLRQFVDVSTARRGAGRAVVGQVVEASTAREGLGEQYFFCIWVSLLLAGCWRSSSGPGNRCEYCSWDAGGAVLFLILAITTAHGVLVEQ